MISSLLPVNNHQSILLQTHMFQNYQGCEVTASVTSVNLRPRYEHLSILTLSNFNF